jgi:hypothetical protein
LLISDGVAARRGSSPPRRAAIRFRDAFASGDALMRAAPSRSMAVRATNRGRRGGIMEPNRVYRWLESLGLNVNSLWKFVPPVVFELRRPLLARFLRALFSGDGGISIGEDAVHLEFCSTSARLAREVRHLLLRFGVVAMYRERQTASGRGASVLSITSKEHVDRFGTEIGFVPGSRKQKRLEEALALIEAGRSGSPTTTRFRPRPGISWTLSAARGGRPCGAWGSRGRATTRAFRVRSPVTWRSDWVTRCWAT